MGHGILNQKPGANRKVALWRIDLDIKLVQFMENRQGYT